MRSVRRTMPAGSSSSIRRRRGPLAPALLPLIDIIVPNETEAATITGGVVAGRTDALAVGRRLVAQGARAALVTLGGDGALYLRCLGRTALSGRRGGRRSIPPPQATPISARWPPHWRTAARLPESLGYAAAGAALSVTRLGAQPSLGSREEVADFIARHGLPLAVAV